MNIQSLAVKHRPKTLSALIGQDHIASQIRGMVKAKRIPSAIMLHGPTGLGKTTIARMFAKIVNCSDLDAATCTPCGECPNCNMADHPDVAEMNMADVRGIDDVRSLIQQSRNMPSFGTKRLFILDEAHQLPTLSQQTLLKPLEEAPPNTIWIICTMTPDKMLPAIAKRCLSLQVKAVEPELLVKNLYRIAKREGVDFKTIDDGTRILKTIANFANGGVRESITLLESVLFGYSSGDTLDVETVLTKFLSGTEADLDAAAAHILLAILSNDLKLLVTSVPTNARGALNKLRWLLDYLINNAVGAAKYTPYSGRVFATKAKSANVRVSLPVLLQLQNLLVEIEWRLNSINVDDRVIFLSMLGDFTVKNSK